MNGVSPFEARGRILKRINGNVVFIVIKKLHVNIPCNFQPLSFSVSLSLSLSLSVSHFDLTM